MMHTAIMHMHMPAVRMPTMPMRMRIPICCRAPKRYLRVAPLAHALLPHVRTPDGVGLGVDIGELGEGCGLRCDL